MNTQFKNILSKVLPALVCAVMFVFVDSAFAQQRKPVGAKAVLKVTGLPGVEKKCLVASPEFDGRVKGPRRKSNDKRWAMFEVEYESYPEWIDEATFTFYVMSQDEKTKKYHFFQTALSYLNIAKGEHGAAVLLPPSAVARYGVPKFFRVEITIDGALVAKHDVGLEGWVEKTEQLGSKVEKIERHSGYLQDRSKTPFGMTFIDEYEVVR